MRRPLVAGNWKMNGSKASINTLLEGINNGLEQVKNADVAVCPPFVFIDHVASQISEMDIALGAQNVSQHQEGAYTGEISAKMLLDFSCEYVIVGHSERRTLYGETDEIVAKKFVATIEAGLKPILCVGELLEERENNKTEEVVTRQLNTVLSGAGVKGFENAVIAYEPVWAIGTGKTATPEQAQQVHALIRHLIAEHDVTVADQMRILYGGSVKAANAKELFGMNDIDGGLIGGASLNADEFLAICNAWN